MTIKSIIFDWDGTIAQTLTLWLDGYRQAFHKRGYTFDDAHIVREFYYNHHTVPGRYPDLPFADIAAETRDHVGSSLATLQPYPGTDAVLNGLLGLGLKLSLVTSSPRQVLSAGLNACGVDGVFESIVCGDDGFGHKPDTRPFTETLRRLGASPDETIIIGDARVDIEAGQALGCETCWFAPQSNTLYHDFSGIRHLNPDVEIDSLDGLLAHVHARQEAILR